MQTGTDLDYLDWTDRALGQLWWVDHKALVRGQGRQRAAGRPSSRRTRRRPDRVLGARGRGLRPDEVTGQRLGPGRTDARRPGHRPTPPTSPTSSSDASWAEQGEALLTSVARSPTPAPLHPTRHRLAKAMLADGPPPPWWPRHCRVNGRIALRRRCRSRKPALRRAPTRHPGGARLHSGGLHHALHLRSRSVRRGMVDHPGRTRPRSVPFSGLVVGLVTDINDHDGSAGSR